MTEIAKHKNQTPKVAPVSPEVHCPFCNSTDTHCEAAFGTTHAYAQFYCRSCRTPFEWIKWEDQSPVKDLPAFLETTHPHSVSLS